MKIYSPIYCSMVALASIISCNADAAPAYNSRLSGFEFGAGVPLVTPLTGYNVFAGYVNKNASTFFGRRFGFRADFTLPSNLRLGAKLSDNNTDGYDVNLYGKVLGFDVKHADFSDEKITVDYIEDDQSNPINIGADAVDAFVEVANKNMGLLIDFYPFGDTWFLGGLRISGGYYIGNLDIKATARMNNDIDYRYSVGNAGDYLHAQIEQGSRIGADFHWKYHGPYAGLGFDLGIWRGFKFYMDAGVVFSNAPHVSNNNIDDKHFVLKGCYEVNGMPCGSEMVTILSNGAAEKPDVSNIVKNTVAQSVKTILTSDATYANVVAQIPGFATVDIADLANDVINYLDDVSTADWITELITNNGGSDLEDTITDIKSEWQNNADNATAGIQQDINQAWDDYEKAKNDAIDDVNDFLKDYGIVPMVKIGFMYRF